MNFDYDYDTEDPPLEIGEFVRVTKAGRDYADRIFKIVGFKAWDMPKDVVLIEPVGFEVKPGPGAPYAWDGTKSMSVSVVDIDKLSPLEQLGLQSE